MSKKCYSCKITKDVGDFNKNSCRKDKLNSICRECGKIRSKRFYQEHLIEHRKTTTRRKKRQVRLNQAWKYDYLKTHPCVDCGETDPVVLEFDHRGDKERLIGRSVALGCSIETISKEVEKCDVRCANCHRRKTAKDFKHYAFLESNKP